MQIINYDKTFQGFLSAVFDIYEYRFKNVKFSISDTSLFGETHSVVTSEENASRVWKGLLKYISSISANQLYKCFLSEHKEVEQLLYRYIKYVFDSKAPIDHDYSNEAVLGVWQTAKKVYREKHRMEAFVRFKLTKEKLYYAIVEPDFNVLPLIINHFQKRYADQRWMIYDMKRKYGIHYDLKEVTRVIVNFVDKPSSESTIIHDEKEELYQDLWKNYFNSVNIPSRKNMKLHIQHMPYRYWKYLIEKESNILKR